jgi:ribosomal protein S18 acetylase RimI-like enzyme
MRSLILVLLVELSNSFTFRYIYPKYLSSSRRNYQKLSIDTLDSDGTILSFDQDKYHFALVEEKDLIEVSELSMISFYNPRLKLDTKGMVGIEKKIWNGVIGVFNSLDKMDARNSHFVGFRSRCRSRLLKPGLHISADSILLALLDSVTRKLVGVVEVSLENPDGKLAPAVAFQVPWRGPKEGQQPYLCNLCVDDSRRRQGLGVLLCKAVELIAMKYWKKDVMYLHVEESNLAAQKLYEKMGYVMGPQLPSWERKLHGLETILYYVKQLDYKEDDDEGEYGEEISAKLRDNLGLTESDFEIVSKGMSMKA